MDSTNGALEWFSQRGRIGGQTATGNGALCPEKTDGRKILGWRGKIPSNVITLISYPSRLYLIFPSFFVVCTEREKGVSSAFLR